MRLAIELAAENVRQGTGGPFGAIVADTRLGEVVGVGVNLVTSSLVSMAHAEIVALSLSQATEGDWDLSHKRPLTLFATCEPCAMCFGALPWSGIETLVVGARTADAEAAGFDEGAKPDRWIEALAARGIAVRTDVLRDEAVKLFELYRELGGEIYGPREVRA
ncbi:MAG: nucleoside deaminase [Gammaproteobacteria bacterium]|nr:nucleoside deaminase [Gammaproteobacteria bacterium]